MTAALAEVISAFTDVVGIFLEPPLVYIVCVAIVGAAVAMISGLFGRD